MIGEKFPTNPVDDSLFNKPNKELELLKDICQGMSRAEIAHDLGLSPNYVKNRIQALLPKLGAENINDAIRIAASMKLI